jgi:hypothetical protein
MPYIPTKQEEARQKKWKTEKERKDNILNTSFDKLTMKQQDAFKELWSALHDWDNELAEMDGDLLCIYRKSLTENPMEVIPCIPKCNAEKGGR